MLDAVEKPARAPLAHYFTPETSAENARKATIARESRRKLREQAIREGNGPGMKNRERYIDKRLSRVRKQLAKLDGMIDKEMDAQKLDRLVCAQNRLSEQWRILSGIPLPGSNKPSSPPRKAGGNGQISPLD